MSNDRKQERFSVSGALAGAIGVFVLMVPLLLFAIFVGVPRALTSDNKVYPASAAPGGYLHPAIQVIAKEKFERDGTDGVVRFTEMLQDNDQKDACLMALIQFQLGEVESFEDALSAGPPKYMAANVLPAPAPIRRKPPSLAARAPAAPTAPDMGAPAAPNGPAPAAPRSPALTMPDEAKPAPKKTKPIERAQIAAAITFMKKLSSPFSRDKALASIFRDMPKESLDKLVDDSLIRDAVAQLNESHAFLDPYRPDPVDEIILGDIAAEEYRVLRAKGEDSALIPDMLDKKLKSAYAKIRETKQVPKYGMNLSASPRVADSIETQKKILTETARDREARWWAALSTLGTGLITAVGFIGGGLLVLVSHF